MAITKKLILAAVLATVMLTGCDNKDFSSENGVTGSYRYFVDNHTGVVYIEYNGGYRGGITVALNADGTPVTKEQFEAWRGDNDGGGEE